MPIQGWMDRLFFDFERNRDNDAMEAWRINEGHQPVPDGWTCPWTDPAALDDWIAYNLAALDHAYENGLLWVPTWHPYTPLPARSGQPRPAGVAGPRTLKAGAGGRLHRARRRPPCCISRPLDRP